MSALPRLLLALTLGAVTACSSSTAAPPMVVDWQSGQLYTDARTDPRQEPGESAALVAEGPVVRAYTPAGEYIGDTPLSPAAPGETCSGPAWRPLHAAFLEGEGTLVAGDWDAAPRRGQALSADNANYRGLLADWLRERGVEDPAPTLSQLWRVDLDGDARDEVLLAATRHRGSATSVAAGDYSVLLLRRLVDDGEVLTLPVMEEVYTEECIAECALSRHELFGVLDVDGDGRLEIISRSTGYESMGQAIHAVTQDGVSSMLQWHCGA